jgi:hypothetical protein
MQEAQDWCLQCGTGERENARSGPGWRTAALAFGSTAILALGAAAAAYAALKQSSPHPQGPVTPIAQTPTTSSTLSSSSTTSSSDVPSTPAEGLPAGTGKPPKIPSSEPTPSESEELGGGGFFNEGEEESEEEGKEAGGKGKGGKQGKTGGKGQETGKQGTKEGEENCEAEQASASAASLSVSGDSAEGEGLSASEDAARESDTETTSQTSSSQSSSAGEAEEESEEEETEEAGNCKQAAKQAPILLDTNAASTYDPNGYPEAAFGDPSLAIDGESTTAWTAPLAPEIAPLVQSGLLLNLKAQRRIAKVTLITSTPGMSVQVYGTTQRKPPSSLNSAAWVKLSHVHVASQRKSSVELRRSPQKIRQLLVWIVKAPEGAESIAIGEAELYEPK